jgi:hypothetical protein
LGDAFDAYEAEIAAARQVQYGSQEEADAASVSLTPKRFDWLLEVALGERGLTIDDMGAYARLNPNFFMEQQRLYWGRLDQLSVSAATIPDMVQEAEPEQISMLDSE